MRMSVSGFVAMLFLTAATAPPPAAAAGCAGTPAPDIAGKPWLNSEPLHLARLRDKVVLVEFWTLGCSNCRNVEPYVKQWHAQYAGRGLVVVGVHTPEFDYEKDLRRVEEYVRTHGIRYPVVIDNDYVIWNRYANRYWPAMYLIDKHGAICSVHIGEGGYAETEQKIRQLLAER